MSSETDPKVAGQAGGKLSDTGALAFQIFCALIFLGMVSMVFFNAVLRYCFNSGYPPSEEWARFLFIYITFFGAIEAFYRHKHIAVDLVVERFGGVTRKTIEVLATLASIFALFILLQGGYHYVLQTADTYAIATHVNMVIINITLPIMALASIILQVKDLIKLIRKPSEQFVPTNALPDELLQASSNAEQQGK